MKTPVDHVLRPKLPWRPANGGITECGYDASAVKSLTREDFFVRLKEFGQQRTALLTCMTCSDTARRWRTWEQDPREAMEREIIWERGGVYRARDDRGERLRDELFAIAALVEAHREEFDAFLAERIGRREWVERKTELSKRKPVPNPRSP